MAMNEISTGYRPEFGLGALYQGFNAGNADMSAQEELIKQFLANQHASQMNPIEQQQAGQNLLAGMYKTSPEYQDGMRDTISGQGMSSLAAGQNATVLQPFKQEAERAQLQQSASRDRLFGNMFRGVEQQHDQSLPENQRESGAIGSYLIADTLSEIDPKFMQQRKLLGQKGDQAMDLKELDLEGRQRLAAMKTAAVRGDKTAQEALVKHLQNLLATGKISADQYAQELAELQNVLSAAKVQPGPELNLDNPSLAKVFTPKPSQPTYTPPVVGGQQPVQPAKASLEDAIQAELARRAAQKGK